MKALQYTLTKGHQWQRLIMVKDRRTRRSRKLASVSASMQLQGGTERVPIDVAPSYEGGALLCFSQLQTEDLTPGVWDFDVVGNFRGELEKIAQGTITVEGESRITSLNGGEDMYISIMQFTDYRRVFTWQDSDGNTIGVDDARMQIRDTDDALVGDINYFATPPDEVAVAALPANERGYLSPIEGASLELHISDQIVVSPGTYTFNILAQEAGGDWGELTSGTLVIEDSITDPSV